MNEAPRMATCSPAFVGPRSMAGVPVQSTSNATRLPSTTALLIA
jgi:hypothetical protein